MKTFSKIEEPVIPSKVDTEISKISSQILVAYSQKVHQLTEKIKIVAANGTEEVVEIPMAAFRLLVDIVHEMSQGKAINLTLINSELTIAEAANLLNVSYPYLIQLLESGSIPYRQVRRHKKIYFEDVIKYKKSIDNERLKVLDELADQAQELNMGYE